MTMFVNPFFEIKGFMYWHRFILMETARRAKLSMVFRRQSNALMRFEKIADGDEIVLFHRRLINLSCFCRRFFRVNKMPKPARSKGASTLTSCIFLH